MSGLPTWDVAPTSEAIKIFLDYHLSDSGNAKRLAARQFIAEMCVQGDTERVSTFAFHREYTRWATENGEEEFGLAFLARRLKERGFEPMDKVKDAGRLRRGFRGIRLNQGDWTEGQ